jgi:hypothetical protein
VGAIKVACMIRGKDKEAIDQVFKSAPKLSGKKAAEAPAEEPSAKKPKKETKKASEAAADADAKESPATARRSGRARK